MSQNGLIEENDGHTRFNYVQTREQEERESIPNSFDDIVNNIHLNVRYLTENEGLMKDEISIPDTVNIGSVSDTLFANIRVKGMKRFASQNMTMLWGENVVSDTVVLPAYLSWKNKLIDFVLFFIIGQRRKQLERTHRRRSVPLHKRGWKIRGSIQNRDG